VGHHIDPTAIYDDRLFDELGLSPQLISRACNAGHLQHIHKGRTRFFKGAWILAWLGMGNEPDATQLESEAVHAC
jgi:hypothetical protein